MVLEESVNACVCVCEPRHLCARACTSDIPSLPAEEEEGDLSVRAYVSSPINTCC